MFREIAKQKNFTDFTVLGACHANQVNNALVAVSSAILSSLSKVATVTAMDLHVEDNINIDDPFHLGLIFQL